MAVHSPLILLIVILMAHIHVMNSTSSKKASLQEQEEKAQSPEKHLTVDPRMEDFNSLGDEIDEMVHRKVAGEKYAKDRMEKLSNLTTFLAKVPPIEEGEDESEVRLSPLEEMIKDVNMSAGEAHKFREEWEHASSRDSQVLLLAAYCDYLQGTLRRFFNKKRTDRDVEDDFWVVIFGLKKLGLDHLMEAVVKQRPELAGLDVKEQIREVASLMVDGHVGLHDWHLVLLKEAALGHNNPRAALHQEVVEKCGQVLHFYFIRKQMLVPSAAAAAAVVE